MFDRIVAFVSLAAAVAAYFISHSLLITILVMIACVMITRSLRPLFQAKLESAFPDANVYYIREENLDNQQNGGMKVIMITEKIFFHTEVDADKAYILQRIDETADRLCEANDIFRYRYNYVIKHNLSYQYAYAACKNEKSSLKYVYNKWFTTSGLKNFGFFEDDKDSFSVDDTVIDPRDNSEHRAMIQFVFDPAMPLPDEKYKQ